MFLHRLTVGLDARNDIVAWHHRVVGQSIFATEPQWLFNGIDLVSIAGAADIPNILVELHSPTNGVTIRTWRGNAGNHTAYAVETVLDGIAKEAGRDPLELRLSLLRRDPHDKEIIELNYPEFMRPHAFAKHGSLQRVLEFAAEKAGWSTPLPKGRGRGIAVHYAFASPIARIVAGAAEMVPSSNQNAHSASGTWIWAL